MQRLRPIEKTSPSPDGLDRPDVVELRVHGVSGTPPEELLDSYDIERVRGDAVAGFFRRRHPDDDAGVDIEAYSWGGLTSRSWTRALWVLLGPFALVNVAGWMLPGPPVNGHRRWPHVVAHGAIRLLALHMTVMVIMWVGQVTVEFMAFQFGGLARDLQGVTWLRTVLGGWSLDAPGRRLAVGSLPPIALAAALWWLGRPSRTRYENSFAGTGVVGQERDSFADPTFWRRPHHLQQLARLHVGAAMATMAYLLTASTAWSHQFVPAEVPSVLVVTKWLALALLAAIAGSVALARPANGSSGWQVAAGRSLPVLSALAFLQALVAAWVWHGGDPVEAAAGGVRLDPYGDAANRGLLIAVAVGLILLIATWRHPERHERVPSPVGPGTILVGFKGFGAVATSLLGYFGASVALLGIGSWSARLLGGRPVIDYPTSFDAASVMTVWGLSVIVSVAAASVWFLASRMPQGPADAGLGLRRRGESDEDFESDLRRRWVATVGRMNAVRRLVDYLDAALLVVILAGAFLLLPIALAPLLGWPINEAILGWTWDWVDASAAWLIGVGVPLGLFLTIRSSLSSTRTRRLVGILWDVLTFWPRWYHPLAPPNYSARAVPELQTRIDVLTQADQGVVLSAHSQGAVLALAALDGFQPGRASRAQAVDGEVAWARIALLTYGCPITRLYLRFFPAHMREPIRRVHRRLCDAPSCRWINLYRATDPIGGAIAGERPDWTSTATGPPDAPGNDVANPLLDPPGLPEPVDDDHDGSVEAAPPFPLPGDPYPAPDGHSRYHRDPIFWAAQQALRDAVSPEGTSLRR